MSLAAPAPAQAGQGPGPGPGRGSSRAGGRPVSVSYHHTPSSLQGQLQDDANAQLVRDRSGSGSLASSSGSTTAHHPPRHTLAYDHQLPHNPLHTSSIPSTSSSSGATQHPSRGSSPGPSTSFHPIALPELLSTHGNNPSTALSSLLSTHHALLAAHERETHERGKLASENSKLWGWLSGLKKDRDALSRDIRDSLSKDREVRALAMRVMELEAALRVGGLPVPPPSRDRLSPANSLLAGGEGEGGQGYPGTRRPSPGPRSVSDSGPSASTSASYAPEKGRERQRSERGGIQIQHPPQPASSSTAHGQHQAGLSNSNSAASFMTASSEPGPGSGSATGSYAHSSGSSGSLTTAARSGDREKERERERERRKLHSSGTPTVSARRETALAERDGPAGMALSTHRAGVFADELDDAGEGELSSRTLQDGDLTASPQQTSFVVPPYNPHHYENTYSGASGGRYPASSALSANPSIRSDTASSPSFEQHHSGHHHHLRTPKHSHTPISPALSNASSFAQSHQSSVSAPASHHNSPRSPIHRTASPSFPPHQQQQQQGSPTSPRHFLHQSSHHFSQQQQQQQREHLPSLPSPSPSGSSGSHYPQSTSVSRDPSAISAIAADAGAGAGVRTLRRKASSLDLTSTSEKSPIPPSRSATPPPSAVRAGSGSGPRGPESPSQYAVFAPRTPPQPPLSDADGLAGPAGQTPLAAGPGHAGNANFSTPLVELPDEARRYIMAQNGGLQLPSPISPFGAMGASPRRNAPAPASKLGGLGISSGRDDPSTDQRHTLPPQHSSQALQHAMGQHSSASSPYPASQYQHPHHQQQPVRSMNGRASPSGQAQQDARLAVGGAGQDDSNGSFIDSYADNTGKSGSDETPPASSPVKTARPNPPERGPSDRQIRDQQIPQQQQQQLYSQQQHTQYQSQSSQQQQQAYAQPHPSSRQPHIQPPPPPRSQQQASSRPEQGSNSAPFQNTPSVPSTTPLPKSLALAPALLPLCQVEVVNSSIRQPEKGKDIVSFLVRVKVSRPSENNDPRQALFPPHVPTAWIIEKTWADLQALDAAIKAKNAKANVRKLHGLPDKSLFKDHAPSKADQRKRDLQRFLQGICESKLHELQDFCIFLTSSIVSDRSAPITNPGYKAGYLTKKGRNFGGWATRYYVLQGRMLEYYDYPGGGQLGAIDIKDANIGRQNAKSHNAEDIRHAFLVRAKDKTGEETDHILCAESDEERDHWVSMLVCCLTGEYVPDTVAATAPPPPNQPAASTGRPPQVEKLKHHAPRKGSREIEITRTAVQPISQLSNDPQNQKLFGGPSYNDPPSRQQAGTQAELAQSRHRREQSAGQSSTASGQDEQLPSIQNRYRRGYHGSDLAPSSSLPTNLSDLAGPEQPSQQQSVSNSGHAAPLGHRFAKPVSTSDVDPAQRPKSPDKRVKISGPTGGAPIGPDFKRSNAERKAKAKSSFWDFAGRRTVERPTAPSRPVFGVPIQEAVETARVKEDSDLPAVVFRCVQYLSSVKAENEEGIYRMSGSSAVIKNLKDRFNAEGDVDLTSEYFDPHAVAGLLKTYFRELPVHIFTAELHPEFLKANDIPDRNPKIRELARLVQQLPVANYSALRFLSAHLVKIVQKEQLNKMNVKNLGIVFSPTLAIPATLFTLFVTEFDRVFLEQEQEENEEESAEPAKVPSSIPEIAGASENHERPRTRTTSSGATRRRSRNSMLFTQSGADRLLEIVSDLEDAPEEDEAVDALSVTESEHMRNYRSPSPALSHEEHILPPRERQYQHFQQKQHLQQQKNKLTIDVSDHGSSGSGRSVGDYASQRSPSAMSANSPRHLQAPLRSPGLPNSPRNTEGALSASQLRRG